VARLIFRYSFGSGRENVGARNATRGALQDGGLRRTGTGTFEGEGEREGLLNTLDQALEAARNAPTLDHLWIYLGEDEPDASLVPEED
jgi:hypothetical protein